MNIQNKKLTLHRTQNCITTLNRLIKYEKSGYTSEPNEFKLVADKAVELILKEDIQAILKDYFYRPPNLFNEQMDVSPKEWFKLTWKYLRQANRIPEMMSKMLGGKNEQI